MLAPLYREPLPLPKTVEVVESNDEGFEPGTRLQVSHAMSSVLCVVHPVTQKHCYIRRAQVRGIAEA